MNNKIALVTGSYRGIGLEVVKQLAQRGHTVILTSRREESGLEGLKKINNPENVIHHLLDVNSQESVDVIKDFVLSKFGKLDILVNNAAINYDTWHNTVDADLIEVEQTLNTNLLGAWRMAQAFIPSMAMNVYGRIVNVSSGSGAIKRMGGGTPGYGISKAALNALTIKLAAELKSHNVIVNSVCPGWVKTDMGGPSAPRSVEQGAETIVWAALLEGRKPNGKFLRDKKVIDF